MQIEEILSDKNVISFLLLFIRLGAIFYFFPFYSNQAITMTVKGAMTFFLALIFFPILPSYDIPSLTIGSIMMAVLAEILFGFLAGLMLMITFQILLFAGEQISIVLGFTMANIMDPSTQIQTTVVGQFLNLTATLLLLSFNGHHLILEFINMSLSEVPLGHLTFNAGIMEYFTKAMLNFYIIGFTIAFPIISIGLLLDTIFGMIMKTIPQFQIIVVGIPIKTGIALFVVIAIFAGIFEVWEEEYFKAFQNLQIFFNK
jgi:flagellar biosynthetic protein FliR